MKLIPPLFSGILFSGILFAQSTPQVIKLQGSLIQTGVGPITGTVTMSITLHDAPIEGQTLAVAGPMSVVVNDGLYAVGLPFPPSAFSGADRWVEIMVNGETLSPRILLGSSAFAYVAETVDGHHAVELEESAEIDEKVSAHEASTDPHPIYVLRSGDSMAGDLHVVGVIESLVGGFRFPDGSVQWTAATGGGGGGAGSFDSLTTGMNTSATMVVGPGASLSASGGGTIVATSAPDYLPVAGGTMTGVVTTRSNGTAIELPPATPGNLSTALRFSSDSSDRPLSNAPWYISLDESHSSGDSSMDNVLSFSYNALRSLDGSLSRTLLGEHAVLFNLESGWCWGEECAPNDRLGNFEWNIGIDTDIYNPAVEQPLEKSRKLFFSHDMDTGKTMLTVGAVADTASDYFEFGNEGRGLAGAAFVLADSGQPFVLYRRPSDPARDPFEDPNLPGGIVLDPGIGYSGAVRNAIISRSFLPSEDDLNIEPGLSEWSIGTTGDIYLGHYRLADVILGHDQAGSSRFTIDGAADVIQETIRAYSAQTSDLFVIEDSTGQDLFKVTSAGTVVGANLTGANTGDVAAGRSITLTGGNYDADAELYTQTRCLNVDPNSPITDILFFRADAAITVTGIDCIVDSGTSLVLTLRECDDDAGSCAATEAAITCGTTNTTEAGGIDDPAVDAGHYLRVLTGTKTGAPTQAMICATFTVDD